jgi:hypothetical protein
MKNEASGALATCFMLVSFLVILHPIEFQQTKRRCVEEDGIHHNHRCENLNPHRIWLNENNNP